MLGLAGLARHRPFDDNSAYARLGRALASEITPRVAAIDGQRIGLNLCSLVEPMIFEEIFVEHTYPVERVPFEPDLVLDCGAFSGMFSLLAHARFPSARIIAFEPEPHNFHRLERNLALNHAAVEVMNVALGTSEGSVRFTGGGFGGHLIEEDQEGSITVRLLSLASLLRQHQPRRLILKMDIEGSEREILPDIAALLPPQTVIFLETHHSEAECRLYLRPLLDAGFNHEIVRQRPGEDVFIERMLVRQKSPVRHFCTYFDHNYAALGLALYQSLKQHCPIFQLWVLCLDNDTFSLLEHLALPGVRPIQLAEFERNDAALCSAKANRSRVEYIFTCTPSLPLYVLAHDSTIDLVTYLDADLFFFASPEPLFDEMGSRSIAIIPHRFSPDLRHLENNGVYNVGWLSFRRDATGLSCLHWWRSRCLSWCQMKNEPDRFADQKYLDRWPQQFPDVAVLEHKGANLALWNIENHRIANTPRCVVVGNVPLIFFHFHGLRRPRPWIFSLSLPFYGVRMSAVLLHRIFAPYAKVVLALEQRYGLTPQSGSRLSPQADETMSSSPLRRVRFLAHVVANILRKNYLLVLRDRVAVPPW